MYATYLGGSDMDGGIGIAVDLGRVLAAEFEAGHCVPPWRHQGGNVMNMNSFT